MSTAKTLSDQARHEKAGRRFFRADRRQAPDPHDSALLSDYARESAAHERSIPGSIVFDRFRKLRSRSEMACRNSVARSGSNGLMSRRRRTPTLTIAAVFVSICAQGHAAQPSSLTLEETAAWMAVGRRCQAPVTRIPSRDGTFDIYIESPAARAAVVAATATMMHQSLEATGVKTALKDGYRIWASSSARTLSTLTIDRISVRPRGGASIEATDVRRERLFLGTVASHGIIEPLRARFPEFIFRTLPPGPLEVVLHMPLGVQRYRVTDEDRSRLIGVCNE